MRLLPFLLLLAMASCAAEPATDMLDRSSHVSRVLEDVSAMLEGMAEAHASQPVVLREPSPKPDGTRARN